MAYFLGVRENDDPRERFVVVANFNNDIGDRWECSDTGGFPVNLSNEVCNVGVDYVIYALAR